MANTGDYRLDGDTVLGFDGSSWIVVPRAIISKDDSEMTVIVRVGDAAVPAPTGVLELPGLSGYTGFVSVTGVGSGGNPPFPDAVSEA